MITQFADAFMEARKINGRAPRELAMRPADWNADLCPARAAVEIKHDGIGFVWTDGDAMSLEGVPFDAASHRLLAVQALERHLGGRMMMQGEFVEPVGGVEAANASFRRGTSTTGILMLWDAVPLDVWNGFQASSPLHVRRQLLEAAFQHMPRDCGVYLTRQAQGFDVEGIEMAAGAAWAGGEEGIVVKDLDSPYVRARSPYWMRIKRTETVDVPIQSIIEGAGLLRSIICTFEGRPITVPVGFSDSQRRTPALFAPGRIVEVKHNGRTKGGYLKSPRFIRFRDDKGVR